MALLNKDKKVWCVQVEFIFTAFIGLSSQSLLSFFVSYAAYGICDNIPEK